MKTVLVNVIQSVSMREDADCSGAERIYRCGLNTGNCCFVDAVSAQLGEVEVINCKDIAAYNEKAVLVFPASNWVNKNDGMLERCFRSIDNTDIQVAVIGLGIQGSIDATAADILGELPQERITALKILSEHSVSIGVRGEITAKVLEKIGIHNYSIIGCPSFYELYRNNLVFKLINEYYDFSPERTVCSFTPYNLYEHKVLELAYLFKNKLILQSMSDLPLTLFEDRDIEQRQINDRFAGLKLSPNELKEYIRERGNVFFSRGNWLRYLQKENISFAWGSRFHGNMMAFSNGIPALWIMHDARTKELIEAMHLPYITHEQLENINTMEELVHIARYDNAFLNSYKQLTLNYIDFLRKNKIENTFSNVIV